MFGKTNDCVLISEDLVKWHTYARRVLHKEPFECESDGITPYFRAQEVDQTFSKNEIQALKNRHMMPCGTMLSRYEFADGSINYIPIDDNYVESMKPFVLEQDKFQQVVFDFLVLLGGSNISCKMVASQNERVNTMVKYEGSGRIGENCVTAEKAKTESFRREESIKTRSSLGQAASDFKAAHEHLESHPWLRERFGVILSQAEKGKVFGKMEIGFEHKCLVESINKASATLDVAIKYKIIKPKIKAKFESETKKILDRFTSWVVAVDFGEKSSTI